VRNELDFDDDDTVVFAREFKIASREGRLWPEVAREMNLPTGKVRCKLCGMLHKTERAAVDCCTTADRAACPAWSCRPKHYISQIKNSKQLLAALEEKRGSVRMEAFLVEHGIPARFASNVARHRMRWIAPATWRALCEMFGGSVPGCKLWVDPRKDVADV